MMTTNFSNTQWFPLPYKKDFKYLFICAIVQFTSLWLLNMSCVPVKQMQHWIMIMRVIECFHCSTYFKHGYCICAFINAQALIFDTIRYNAHHM